MNTSRYKDFNFQHEYIKFSLSLLLAIAAILFTTFLIQSNYNPDTTEAIKKANEFLLMPSGAQPEPKEKIMFMAGIVVGVLGLFGFYVVLNYYFDKLKSKKLDTLYSILLVVNIGLVLLLTYKCFAAPNPFAAAPQNSHDIIGKSNFDFYFIKSFVYKKTFVYLFVLVPSISFLFLFNFKISKSIIDNFNKFSKWFSFAFCILLSLLTIGFCAFLFPYTWENKYDFNAIFYSVVQVYNGFPLLVDDFTNTYGLYPEFLLPLFKLIGFSILSFTSIMGIMLCLCFVFMYYFLNKVVENKWFVLFGFSAVFYMCYIYGKIVANYDPYFAIYPIRWFFPTLLMAFSAFYISFVEKNSDTKLVCINNNLLKQLNINLLRVLAYFIFSIGVLWNPDFGLLTYVSLIAYFVYIDFEYFDLKKCLPKIIANLALAISMLVLMFFFYSVIIKLVYGTSPDMSLLFSSIFSFSVVGFYMLPMSDTWHPWMIVALVYLIGWAISISNFINNKKTLLSVSVFMLTFLGTISLTYYQGRSHNWNLFVTNPEAFLLIAIFANELYSLTKDHQSAKVTFVVVLLYTAYAPFQIIANTNEIKKLVFTENDKRLNKNEQNKVLTTAGIIDNLCEDKERIFVLSADMYQSLYLNLSHTASFVNPGFIDMLSKKQYEHVVDELKKQSPKIFFEPEFYKPLNTQILNVLGSYYSLETIKEAPELYYFNKKKIDNLSLLNTSGNVMLYNNFNADFNRNLELFEGKAPKLDLPEQFSIEIIFKPTSNRVTKYGVNPTLISNFDDTKGFVVQQYGEKQDQYIFGNKNGGILCNVVLDKWNYIVFEVVKQHIKCYVNGQLQSEVNMSQPIVSSDQPLFIGNMRNQGNYFFGNIKEIEISGNIVNADNVKSIWNKVSKL